VHEAEKLVTEALLSSARSIGKSSLEELDSCPDVTRGNGRIVTSEAMPYIQKQIT
jgi:hypothetical protein